MVKVEEMGHRDSRNIDIQWSEVKYNYKQWHGDVHTGVTRVNIKIVEYFKLETPYLVHNTKIKRKTYTVVKQNILLILGMFRQKCGWFDFNPLKYIDIQ